MLLSLLLLSLLLLSLLLLSLLLLSLLLLSLLLLSLLLLSLLLVRSQFLVERTFQSLQFAQCPLQRGGFVAQNARCGLFQILPQLIDPFVCVLFDLLGFRVKPAPD